MDPIFVPLYYLCSFAGLIIWKSTELIQEIRIKGNVTANTFPVQVYAVIKSDSLLQNRDFSLEVPVLKNIGEEYKIIYISGNIISEDRADFKNKQNGEIQLPGKEIQAITNGSYETHVIPKPPEFR